MHCRNNMIAIESTVTEWPLAARCQFEVVRGSDGEDLGRTRLSLNRDRNALIEVSVATDSEKLPIVAEANAKDSRFAPESAFCPLHRLGDLRDWCSSFRMRFEFLNVFLRPRTAMRGRFLRRHEQSP